MVWGCPRTPDRRRGWSRLGSRSLVVVMEQLRCYNPCMAKLVDTMRQAVERSGKSRYRIAKESGVSAGQLSRLVSGERGLNVDTIERLADYLGLRITVAPKAKTTKGR